MSVRYLLPCSCGQTVPVGASQAGGTLRCGACEASLEVPRLGELRELPTAEPEKAATGGWSFRLGVISCFLILAGLLAAGGGWFAATEPKEPEPFNVTARMEAVEQGVENMTPVELWQSYVSYYAPMAQFGIQEAKSPQEAYVQQAIENSRRYRNLLLMGAGGLVLLSALAYPMLPK